MSQLDRHLTTEQLSALLDDLQEEASEQYREHLASCQQCQQELAELRQTVNLLHALPPPALPRSFILPVGIAQITPDRAQSEPNIHTLRSTNSSLQRSRKRTSTGRRVLSLAGTLAAVVGILFVLSGFVPIMTPMGMSTSGSSVSTGASSNSSAASSASSSTNSAGSEATGQKSNMPAIEQPRSIQASQTPDPTHTQNAASVQSAPPQQQTEPQTALPTSFFDWGSTGIRVGLGILLFIAGMMGIAIGRERSKKAKA